MKQEKIHLPELKLVGITVRTNNKSEIGSSSGKIGPMVHAYWNNQIAKAFKHRVRPGLTYSVYTDYESDEHGDYTYFVGEAVSSFEDQDLSTFTALTIPAMTYQKFTTDPGKMPGVVISAWQEIWKMTPENLGGCRRYLSDFEVYDQRARDPENAVVDIYIGISEKHVGT